jgi:hypothetical protein
VASARTKVLAGAVIGVWGLGYGQGVAQHHSSSSASPEVVYQTQYKTVKQVVTEYKDCPGLIDTVNRLGAFAAVVTRDSGQHVDTMTAGGEAIFERNIKALNTAMQKEYNLKTETDAAAAGLAENTAALQKVLKKCKAR